MSNSEADLAAYPLVSWPQSGNNDHGLEGYRTPRAAYYENEARDSRAYRSPNDDLVQRRKGMYPLPQSSSFLTLPTEGDNEEEELHYSTDTPQPMVQNAYANKYSPREQLRTLLFKGFKRFMITFVLVSCLLGTIFGFSTYDAMTSTEVGWYNTLLTGLSMALGISIGSSFKDIALNLRWWFLSQKRRSLKDVDEILECDSLRDLTKHAWRLIKKSRLGMASICIIWVFVNLAAQAGVAMLSLTYSMDPSNAPLSPIIGPVYFTNFSQSFSNILEDVNLPASQYCAHTFGGLGEHFNLSWTDSDDPEDLPIQPFSPYMDSLVDYWESPTYFQYVFTESPADSNSVIGEFYSNRIIRTSSLCEAFSVTENLDGSSSTLHYIENGTTQEIEFQTQRPNSTTYYTSPNIQDCGPRCASVYALENSGAASFYYKCQVNVSEVANTTLPEQMVPDDHARMAAGAIALQGYQALDQFNQSQTFPSIQSIYGTAQNGSSEGMAKLVRKFAIGVFVASDSVLADIDDPVSQQRPGQGVKLSLDNVPGIFGIFGTLLTVHFLLVIIGSFIANKVFVPKDSYVSVSRLLQPGLQKIAGRVGKSGEEEIECIIYCDSIKKGSCVSHGTIDNEDNARPSWGFGYDL